MPEDLSLGQLCVVLVRARNPLNIGAAARAMSNFGCLDLRVVAPHDAGYREARSAVGPAGELLRQSKEFATVSEAVADCTLVVGTIAANVRAPEQPSHFLAGGVEHIRRSAGAGRTALLFGSEKTGLSNEALSYCDLVLHIPTREGHSSMNLGQAVAVCLYEFGRHEFARGELEWFELSRAIEHDPALDRNADTVETLPATNAADRGARATAQEVERISTLLCEALRLSGYAGLGQTEGDRNIRMLVRRLELSREDAAVWTGILRQILWKLRQ